MKKAFEANLTHTRELEDANRKHAHELEEASRRHARKLEETNQIHARELAEVGDEWKKKHNLEVDETLFATLQEPIIVSHRMAPYLD